MGLITEKRQAKAAMFDRIKLQKKIHEKFGKEMLEIKRQELCLRCVTFHKCDLLPITLNGENCPYRSKV